MTRRDLSSERSVREESYRAMFAEQFPRVLRYVERQVSNHAAAEDITADVFKVAWQKFDAEDPFGLPWLIRTAMHKTRDYQRRHYRGLAASSALARRAEEPPVELDLLDNLAVHAAMGSLRPIDLQIVHLTYWDGLTAGEIGQVLRMREGAVWTRLHRARATLRAALDEDGDT